MTTHLSAQEPRITDPLQSEEHNGESVNTQVLQAQLSFKLPRRISVGNNRLQLQRPAFVLTSIEDPKHFQRPLYFLSRLLWLITEGFS